LHEAEEMDGTPIIVCGEAPELLELVEASFDAVAVPVGGGIVRDRQSGG
jgi:hypothetical protein